MPRKKAAAKPKVVDIKCSMALEHVAEQRWLEIHLTNFEEATVQLAEGVDDVKMKNALRRQRVQARGSIILLIQQFCTGKIGSLDIAKVEDIEQIPDGQLISIAEGMIGLAEEEVKKSAASLASSLRVVASR